MIPATKQYDDNYRNLPVVQFLLQVQSPEYVADIISALQILDGIGEERHKLTIDTYLATSNLYDNSDLANYLIGAILDVLHTDLIPFGIKVNGDTPIPIVTGLYETFLGLEDYNDPQTILAICNNDRSDNKEKLGDLLNLFTRYTVFDIDEHLIEVSSSLMTRIQDMASEMALAAEIKEDGNDVSLFADRCKVFEGLYLKDRFNIYQHMTANGYGFGMSPDIYFQEMKNKLMTINANDISRNIVALSLASKMDYSSPEVVKRSLSKIVEGIISDAYLLGKIAGEVNNLISKMETECGMLFTATV